MWLNFQTATAHVSFDGEMDLSNSMDFKHFSVHIFYRLLACPLDCCHSFYCCVAVVVNVIVTVLPFYTSTVAVFYFVVVISIRIYVSFVRSFGRSFIDIVSTAIYIVPIDIDLVSKPYRLKPFFIACYFWIYTCSLVRSFVCSHAHGIKLLVTADGKAIVFSFSFSSSTALSSRPFRFCSPSFTMCYCWRKDEQQQQQQKALWTLNTIEIVMKLRKQFQMFWYNA